MPEDEDVVTAEEVAEAKKIHRRRSLKSRRADESFNAAKTRSLKKWRKRPNRVDMRGVDTLKREYARKRAERLAQRAQRRGYVTSITRVRASEIQGAIGSYVRTKRPGGGYQAGRILVRKRIPKTHATEYPHVLAHETGHAIHHAFDPDAFAREGEGVFRIAQEDPISTYEPTESERMLKPSRVKRKRELTPEEEETYRQMEEATAYFGGEYRVKKRYPPIVQEMGLKPGRRAYQYEGYRMQPSEMFADVFSGMVTERRTAKRLAPDVARTMDEIMGKMGVYTGTVPLQIRSPLMIGQPPSPRNPRRRGRRKKSRKSPKSRKPDNDYLGSLL